MANGISIHDFNREVGCNYKEEQYSVRDNGAVFRYARVGKRLRPNDNQWTFGNPNDNTGYMDITSIPVHRIIATAFHGIPPTVKHVVDHIDTNKRNNRPDNLRWVTRLENILLNPITAKRIERICGSVEAFLAEPSKFQDKFPDPNFSWMCTVSAQEAKISLERMLAWANTDQRPAGSTLSEWVINRGVLTQFIETPAEPSEIVMAKTPNAAQRDWRTPSEFLCCPQEFVGAPLTAYSENLKVEALFCRNDYYSCVVSKSALSEGGKSLFVITEDKDVIKRWGLAQITYEDGLYMHTSLHKFFSREGAEKQFTLAQGLEWTGGDSIDDYC
jgi:hypothetical protein